MTDYDDYEREYNANLSRIRSFLVGTRSRETLVECERLLSEAKRCATAMQGLAEVEGNPMKIREAQQRVDRDVGPLSKEVQRALQQAPPASGPSEQQSREELFANHQSGMDQHSRDLESLITSSDDLLRESQALMVESETIGNSTLGQMGRQRDQLHNANSNVDATLAMAGQAGAILTSMSRKAWRSKMSLYVMIIILFSLNLWLLIRILKKNGK
mmetsp:Transcript_16000/g.44863  ORF Transcript_16000/g.44863 Transcript_16000/m.44863 type:complete len:215 (+) Transcript_16000:113-757(+)|eukprot:CAMPEP_0119547696 /NCGR_PEP_ID=MMETSP1352-20130426/1759_1 /TAXON_ID=265584 /ORGANISM="Stauroneis constricta, Strain CCMP1120" /LENGTH=214 /DNA_ID=CAMNT_0007592695 /DNA_START=112 /DNA_END=756 /DNA_ORIENTATION=-